jgi:hypothetical protein
MENSIKPDPRYTTKCIWIHLTVSLSLLFIAALIHLIIVLAGGEILAAYIIWLIMAGFVILLWIISYPITRLWIKNLSYFILEDRVSINKGILTKTRQNIPFRSITDFALEQTIFDRLLHIGSIKIQTAGQSHSPSGYEGKLAGLIDFETLHGNLRKKIRQLHPTSEALTTVEPVEQRDAPLLNQILAELKEIRRVLQKNHLTGSQD